LAPIGSRKIGDVMSEFKQVAGQRHLGRQRLMVGSGLLGFAPVIEVGENAPFLQRLNLLNDGVGNLFHNFKKLIPPTRGIRKDDQEECGRLAAPIGLQRRFDAEDVRP
jgi:hypothetical protein